MWLYKLTKSIRKTSLLVLPAFCLGLLLAVGLVSGGASARVVAGLPGVTGAPAAVSSAAQPAAKDQPFDCSRIKEMGLDKQMNLRAAEILAQCGYAPEVPKQTGSQGGNFRVAPEVYGGPDVNVHPSNSVAIQSESFSWKNGNTVVVTYNDLSGGSTGKGSYSTDGGVTFARIPGDPFVTGHGTNVGDPAVVYDVLHAKWVATFLSTGCGGQGIGAWNSTDGITWAPAGCAGNAVSGDRNSAWQDNTGGPFNGRSYVSYNDFGIGDGALRTAFSTDGGTTWSAPVTITGSFIRDVQLTGLPNGNLVLAGMNENGGGAANRTNIFYLSSNGGATWATVTVNTYAAPGEVNCSGNSYFRVITPQIRHMGWGQPGAGLGNVVHYAYTAHGTGADEGDIYYIRSTDGGITWSTPIKLNTDAGTRAQWMPSLAVTAGGAVFVKWYDRRDTTNNDYWIYGRASLDNGLTWQADMAVSDAVIPQPIVQTANCYMGDYDYWQADGTSVQGSWTDSRGVGSGGTQDVFHDSISLIIGTPTPTFTGTPPTFTRTPTRTSTPTVTNTPCGSASNYAIAPGTATIVPGTTSIGSACDDCVIDVALPFPFTLYGQVFNQVGLDSNGKANFPTGTTLFANTCLPQAGAANTIYPYWDDQRTDLTTCTGGCGIFTSVSGTAPNRIFNIEWRTTYFSGGGTANYELRLYEGQSRFDIVYGAITQGSTTATSGVQRDTTLFTQYFCNGVGPTATGSATYTQPPCPTTVTPIASQTPCLDSNYVASTGTATLVPGTTDIGNHCDDCTTTITLPFAYSLYGGSFTNANVSSNGTFQFGSNNATYINGCLPDATFNTTVFPFWDDLYTADTAAGEGIFTSVSGSAPNRIFNVEWRAVYCCTGGTPINDFEIRLYEGQNRFDVIYGPMSDRASATSGVQQDGTFFTEYFCNGVGGAATGSVTYTQAVCAPTSTPTGTSTPTSTPTESPSLLVGHVVWQGRPTTAASFGQVMPLTLTLKLGSSETNYPPTIPTYIDTDASGFFTVDVSTLPGDTYQWRLKGPSYLASSGTLVLGGGVTQAELGLQRAGDISGDNLVNIADFNTVKVNFGTGGAPPINPDRDLRK
jgi:hypothetical protein